MLENNRQKRLKTLEILFNYKHYEWLSMVIIITVSLMMIMMIMINKRIKYSKTF